MNCPIDHVNNKVEVREAAIGEKLSALICASVGAAGAGMVVSVPVRGVGRVEVSGLVGSSVGGHTGASDSGRDGSPPRLPRVITKEEAEVEERDKDEVCRVHHRWPQWRAVARCSVRGKCRTLQDEIHSLVCDNNSAGLKVSSHAARQTIVC